MLNHPAGAGVLTDDLDGSEADETVQFALDDISYKIDLSTANAEALREALASYIAAGRRIGPRASRRRVLLSRGRWPSLGRPVWARENGYQVSGHGRVSSEVRAAYDMLEAG